MAGEGQSAAQRVVVVTGGSRGIGRAICRRLAAGGTRLYFTYAASRDEAEITEALVRAGGGSASGMKADAGSADEVRAFFDAVLAEAGRIDVLVNNAGITRDGLLVRMADKDWEDVLRTNLTGTFQTTRLAARAMIRQRFGRIVNLSSVVGVAGNGGQANYAASKAGIIGFTRSMARELAPRNITVNAVAPGYVETAMTASLPPAARETVLTQIPLGRMGTVEDVAAAVEFLVSENAAYITGQVIHVNGGLFIG